MSELTPVERETIHNGAMNAIAEVSDAESGGLLGMFKKGRASTKVLKELPEPLREAVIGDCSTPSDYQYPADDTMESCLRVVIAGIDAKTPSCVPTSIASCSRPARSRPKPRTACHRTRPWRCSGSKRF